MSIATMAWQAVIGLEVHVQLATRSKIFSGASTAYGAAPNAQACSVDLGLPGVLPVLNRRAVEMAIMLGLALEADIARRSVFARKNYFYPDLPKGYQISQYETPVVANGHLQIRLGDEVRRIAITRAHLEEDAGKSVHGEIPGTTGIDLNRAGTPLLEIVSEPVMHTAQEAVAYMRALHRLVRYLGICDGNMQEGSFRCDANVSLRPQGTHALGTRAEIKNLNSFRYVERAIEYEIARQQALLEDGATVAQETRLYDAEKDETRSMRTKEDAHDYRYFPDPDLLPLVIEASEIERIRRTLPELPQARLARFAEAYRLSYEDASVLTDEPGTADYFEACLRPIAIEPKQVANWITGELFGALNREGWPIERSPVSPGDLNTLVARIADGTISGRLAKQVFQEVWAGEGDPDAIISSRGLAQLSDTAVLESAVMAVIEEHPEQVSAYLAGKEKILGFLVGQVMKRTRGQANPGMVNEILRAKLAR